MKYKRAIELAQKKTNEQNEYNCICKRMFFISK